MWLFLSQPMEFSFWLVPPVKWSLMVFFWSCLLQRPWRYVIKKISSWQTCVSWSPKIYPSCSIQASWEHANALGAGNNLLPFWLSMNIFEPIFMYAFSPFCFFFGSIIMRYDMVIGTGCEDFVSYNWSNYFCQWNTMGSGTHLLSTGMSFIYLSCVAYLLKQKHLEMPIQTFEKNWIVGSKYLRKTNK